MINFITTDIEKINNIIDFRRKVYFLALDLQVSDSRATRYTTLLSELLNTLLPELKKIKVNLAFTKQLGYYSLHAYIPCTSNALKFLRHSMLLSQVQVDETSEKAQLDLKLKIVNKKFVPNETFLQAERERLIQHSSGEMMHEIRQKNIELQKALRDLKSSTELIQTEKMRALGGMTAGVAHELNNPMMGILNFIQYAIKHTTEDDRRYRPLVDAEREVKRCQNIITNLLTFCRMETEGEEEFSTVLLSTLFERILQLLTYKFRTVEIEVIKDYPSNEIEVTLKPNKMQQVILNLVSNALDAMRDTEKRVLKLSIQMHAMNFEFSVSDTGKGIDEETQDKIFEPFFTTKAAGEGTGLGLAVSKGIVEEHGGQIICHSKPSRGTCFTVTIPKNR